DHSLISRTAMSTPYCSSPMAKLITSVQMTVAAAPVSSAADASGFAAGIPWTVMGGFSIAALRLKCAEANEEISRSSQVNCVVLNRSLPPGVRLTLTVFYGNSDLENRLGCGRECSPHVVE